MSTILHVSDLHLGDQDAWERETDDKAGIVPPTENSRATILRSALVATQRHLESQGVALDAVVVSGDLTSQHDPAGFERFRELLEGLELVPPDRTLVVPGNHDVDWSKEPGTPGKYAAFLECARAAGYRTPYCDGVDDAGPDPGDRPIFELDDCVLVGVNSANWCGVRRPTGPSSSKVYDVARVSEHQLERLTEELRDLDADAKVRLAVLHHHLLPVTEVEETKEFESFTNLARLRAWLRAHRFHAVLHGHKHRSTLTWDHIYDLSDHATPARRVLVVSAPSPSTWGADICRLVRVGEATGRAAVRYAPQVVIDTVVAERPERPIVHSSVAVPLDSSTHVPAGLIAIDAETADAAYERLVGALEAGSGHLYNVTCVVRDPHSAESPPSNFGTSIPNSAEWLRDVVDWWQKSAPALVASGDAPFNHGERLYSAGTMAGQLDAAAERLGSTKALVLLTTNGELREGGGAPAFVAVQLVLVTDADGPRLDCVGYFRKQDLTLWWPVNVAELRRIQKRVLDLGKHKGLRAGRLVTIATEAIQDNVLPELAGTYVDRSVDLRPEVLMEMAYRVAHGPASDRDAINKQWKDVLLDIGDEKDFPSLGLQRLLEHLRVFQTVGGRTNVADVIKRLEAVYDRADRAKRKSETLSERQAFATELFDLTGDVLEAVDQAIAKLEDQN